MDEMKKQECKNIDLPEGFKITELGPLPEDWQVVRLGDELIEQKQKNRNEQSLPVYTISNVYGFILSDEFFEKQVYSRNLTNYKIVEKGDFAYNPYRVNVGSLALFRGDNPGLVSPAYTVFRVRSSDRLDPDFLLMLFKSSSLRSEIDRVAMSRGSVRRSLAYKDLSDFHIPLPPLPEQRAIAHVLRTVQRAKEATERVIQATRELKKSLMRYLFMYGPVPVSETGKVLLRDTQAGSVPEHWTVMALGQVVESSFSGGTPSTKVADYWNGDIPWITSAAIAEEDVILQKHQRFITDLGLSKSAAKMAPKDAVIVGTRVGIGKAVVAPSSVAMNQDLTALVLDTRRVEPTFLAYLFKTDAIQRSMQLLARGTTIKGVPRNDLLDLLIPLPPLNKQHAITRILRLVDGRLVAERNKKQALDALFNTLLLNLMEGKVRLPEFAGGE